MQLHLFFLNSNLKLTCVSKNLSLCSVTVGGPLDESCRLQGILNTVRSRGNDLKNTLDENTQVENCIRRRLLKTCALPPTHPIVSVPSADTAENSDTEEKDGDNEYSFSVNESGFMVRPTTPNSNYRPAHQALRTPDYTRHDTDIRQTSSLETGLGIASAERDRRRFLTLSSRPVQVKASVDSPCSNSIDNADIDGPGLPRYRRTNSEDNLSQFNFGCGTELFGGHSAGLIGETFVQASNFASSQQLLDFRDENHVDISHELNQRISARYQGFRASALHNDPFTVNRGSSGRNLAVSQSLRRSNGESSSGSAPWLHATPMLASSFDTVDYRTGLSGHRGLTSKRPGISPSVQRGERRMMSEHRGIGSVRGRSWNFPVTASHQQSRLFTSTSSLGSRFVPMPTVNDNPGE
jgi:hypothetical protein